MIYDANLNSKVPIPTWPNPDPKPVSAKDAKDREIEHLRDEVKAKNYEIETLELSLTNARGDFGKFYEKHFRALVDRFDRTKEDEVFCAGIIESYVAAVAACDEMLEQVQRLRAALEPFARRADHVDESTSDDVTHWHPAVGSPVSVGDLRRARAAMS